MKEKRIRVTINLSRRTVYTLSVILGILILAIGVYALNPGIKPNPGHIISEISPPSSCTANQFLRFNGTDWTCATVAESDPTVTASVKDGVSWGEIAFTGTTGLSDGVDNFGYPDTTVLHYVNLGEDSASSGFTYNKRDDCDGAANQVFTCGPSESRTCYDISGCQFGGNSGCSQNAASAAFRTVTCKANYVYANQ